MNYKALFPIGVFVGSTSMDIYFSLKEEIGILNSRIISCFILIILCMSAMFIDYKFINVQNKIERRSKK